MGESVITFSIDTGAMIAQLNRLQRVLPRIAAGNPSFSTRFLRLVDRNRGFTLVCHRQGFRMIPVIAGLKPAVYRLLTSCGATPLEIRSLERALRVSAKEMRG